LNMDIPLIPRKILNGDPERSNVRISPDGTKISFLAAEDNVLNVWVQTLGKDDARPVTDDKERGIHQYLWSRDNKYILYLRDKGGDENWRLHSVDLESGEIRDLTPFENIQVRILEMNKHHPGELLLAMNKNHPEVHDVYHLDLKSGNLTQIAANPGNILAWYADPDLNVKAALMAMPDGSFDLMVRENAEAEWQQLLTWGPEDTLSSEPLSFTRDGQSLYIRDSRGANTGRLMKVNLKSGESEHIISDDIYDVEQVLLNPDTYEIQAVAFFKGKRYWTVLDKSLKDDFEYLENLSDGNLTVNVRDDKGEKWLIAVVKDDGPISYYLYNRPNRKAEFLFVNHRQLKDYTLAKMEPFSFESRDGLTVYGYLTFPPGKDRANLPAVLKVHGGPWHRDYWGFDPWTQCFANRGYLCIQVNFRGSTGYGKEFVNAGDREWGAKMHDDLIDAVNHVVKEGYADPENIAIFGGSYGGYAALVGATFTPDFFKCAVDIVGPSSLITLIKSIPPYWSTMLATFHRRIGHPEQDEEFLKSRSPLFKVENIKIPILIGQGANDPRVKVAESKQIVKVMKEKNIDYKYIEFPDEGHGFAKSENRLRFMAEAEEFLAKHLGGRFEPQ